MQRKGVRSGRSIGTPFAAALLAAAGFFPCGCSLLRDKNTSLVRVETQRNTARATRLTYAGIRSLNKQHLDLAAKHFREAVEADYGYGPAHNNLGLMHYEQGNLYQAVLAFEQAREYLPDDPAVVYNLGLALESAGRTDEALDLYYTANAMDRANPNYLGNLVRLRVRLGERDDLLQQQLRDLVLIETRPEWRRWADTQIALTVNDALDRGPATPDLESTANDTSRTNRSEWRGKIIDLTPVTPVAMLTPESDGRRFEDLPDAPATDPFDANPIRTDPSPSLAPEASARPMLPRLGLEERFVDDLSEEDYYRP
jgi:tetratricopeptide (TPR) repeat protein